MALVNVGTQAAAAALIGDTVNPIVVYNNANARIGIGDSVVAYAVGQTDLQAAVNVLRVGMEATYPQRNVAAMIFRSLFGLAQGNFDWNEWGIFNAAAGGQMLNRFVSANGVKPGTQSWEFTVTVNLDVGV